MRLSSPRTQASAWLLLVFLWAAWSSSTLNAHMGSTSYLTLRVESGELRAQWDMPLIDLDLEVELDADANNTITPAEFAARRAAAEGYAISNVIFAVEGANLPLRFTDYLREEFTDGSYAVLRFVSPIPDGARSLAVTYRAFFEKDPLHRGLVRLETAEGGETSIFNPHAMSQTFDLGTHSPWRQFFRFLHEGAHHIWIGIDHILFLLALLLPAVLRRESGAWVAVDRFKPALINVVQVVTAFTIAHSVTLSLAALQVVRLPVRLVESTIAASVIVAALNNLRPFLPGRGWIVAFGFGLVHGFGFANVLAELELPRNALVRALVAFNVGVELGQLVIVGIFLPLAFLLRRTPVYRRGVLIAGSTAIVLIASAWMVERISGAKLMPF